MILRWSDYAFSQTKGQGFCVGNDLLFFMYRTLIYWKWLFFILVKMQSEFQKPTNDYFTLSCFVRN